MVDEADEPLIHRNEPRLDASSNSDATEAAVNSAGLFIWFLTLTAGLSGLLFGYDTGVISSTLVSIGHDLSNRSLTTLDKSLITSCTSLCALIASPVTGVLADSLGRKKVLLIADVLFVVGALWQAFTNSIWGMIGGRSIVGLAIGSASFVGPLYIAELSPSRFRGSLVTLSTLLITTGQVVAYVVGWLLSRHAYGWRYLVGFGALPAATQFLLLNFMPDTPRWLVKANRLDEAKIVLARIYDKSDDTGIIIQGVLRKIERELLEEEAAADIRRDGETPKFGIRSRLSHINIAFTELFGVGGHRRALAIACLLQGGQQLCGFNSLMYFSATIFALVGFSSPTLTALSIAITNFAFTLVAFYSIDRLGRRRILLYSIPIMVSGLILCSISFGYLGLESTSLGLSKRLSSMEDNFSNDGSSNDRGGLWATTVLAAMIVYVAGYAIGLGNVPWQQSELFPLNVRSVGSGLSTATNWGSNFLIGLTFLPMMEGLTPQITFGLYAVICVGVWAAVLLIYPETAGLSLEDVGSLLKDGWGVNESGRRWKAKRSNGV